MLDEINKTADEMANSSTLEQLKLICNGWVIYCIACAIFTVVYVLATPGIMK